jgi:hypothetical protein
MFVLSNCCCKQFKLDNLSMNVLLCLIGLSDQVNRSVNKQHKDEKWPFLSDATSISASLQLTQPANSLPIVTVVFFGQTLLIFMPTRKYPGLSLEATVSEATNTLFCKTEYLADPP